MNFIDQSIEDLKQQFNTERSVGKRSMSQEGKNISPEVESDDQKDNNPDSILNDTGEDLVENEEAVMATKVDLCSVFSGSAEHFGDIEYHETVPALSEECKEQEQYSLLNQEVKQVK